MKRLQNGQDLDVTIYHSRVRHFHNPPPYPIQEMYFVGKSGTCSCFHVVFMGDPAAQQEELRRLIHEARPQLEKIGVAARCGLHASVDMFAPVHLDGVMVCVMACKDPKTYEGSTAVAHLMKKVCVRFKNPKMPFPRLLASIPRHSVLMQAS